MRSAILDEAFGRHLSIRLWSIVDGQTPSWIECSPPDDTCQAHFLSHAQPPPLGHWACQRNLVPWQSLAMNSQNVPLDLLMANGLRTVCFCLQCMLLICWS